MSIQNEILATLGKHGDSLPMTSLIDEMQSKDPLLETLEIRAAVIPLQWAGKVDVQEDDSVKLVKQPVGAGR